MLTHGWPTNLVNPGNSLCSECSAMFRICSEFWAMFRICSEFWVIFRICSEFSAMFRICSEFWVIFRIFRHFSEFLAQKLVYSDSLDFVVYVALYEIYNKNNQTVISIHTGFLTCLREKVSRSALVTLGYLLDIHLKFSE